MKKQGSTLLIVKAEFTQLCSSILTPVSVASSDSKDDACNAVALWDTGSAYSGISKMMAERMGLKPLPWKQRVDYADGESREEKVYHIHITFPPSGRRADICAFEFADDGQDIIIGMNIIRCGTFRLEPTDNGTRFSFIMVE